MKRFCAVAIAVFVGSVWPAIGNAEILAMLNYESKSPDALKAFKSPVPGQTRTEGIAVVDVDPASPTYRKIVETIPLPPDLVAHHIFYNRSASKAYVTALGKGELRVIDMSKRPFAMKTIAVPDCQVGEDVVFSEDNKTWYLTCMGSSKLIIGDAASDQPTKTVSLPKPYPHGIAIHSGIDRLLLTNTVRASDLKDAGEMITVVEASTGKVLATHKVSNKPSPAGEAPVEILFVPGANPPVAYITNMFGGTLWTATWNPQKKDFDVAQVFDFATVKSGIPLEIYFSGKANRLYVSTAKPGLKASAAAHTLIEAVPAAVADPGMTAIWEQALDEIEAGRLSLEAFVAKQANWMAQLIEHCGALTLAMPVKAGPACPVCKDTMHKRKGKSGLFWSCSRYPVCKGTLPLKKDKRRQ